MRLLVDSDVFCKLGVGGLFGEALAVLGVDIGDCSRLPALPHMLRRGKLIRNYGADACAALLPVAYGMQIIPAPDPIWLDRIVSVPTINPGEAQLFAVAAQAGVIVITGDKRSLLALKDIDGYPEALAGRIVVLEAILLALCNRLGHEEVRRRLSSLTGKDRILQVCFSVGNSDPRSALESYYRDLVAEVYPLRLWEPAVGGAA